jgi:hypothetical protein
LYPSIYLTSPAIVITGSPPILSAIVFAYEINLTKETYCLPDAILIVFPIYSTLAAG